MKKFLKILIWILICINANFICVKADSYKVNDIVENKFTVNRKFQIVLPSGKWVIAEKSADNYYGIRTKFYSLLRIQGKKIVEGIEIAVMQTAGVYEHYVNAAIYEALFKNRYDGCYERPEYYVLRLYRKGVTHNCFLLGHADLYKELFTPEDPEQKSVNGQLRKYILENRLELPKVGLFSNHFYFSRIAGGKWYGISYAIDPEILGAPKNKFISEESSEYHRNNIENYPEHKEIMKKWISISAQRHIDFENSINALKRHRLDLIDLSPVRSIFLDDKPSDDILKKILMLNELYKSGVLSKDEFDKAKKKLLN